MGPLAVFEEDNTSFLLAYEHGSQYPDRFLEFKLQKNKTVSIASVKGNYLKKMLNKFKMEECLLVKTPMVIGGMSSKYDESPKFNKKLYR